MGGRSVFLRVVSSGGSFLLRGFPQDLYYNYSISGMRVNIPHPE